MERAVNVPGGCGRATDMRRVNATHRHSISILAWLFFCALVCGRDALADDSKAAASTSPSPRVAAQKSLLKQRPKNAPPLTELPASQRPPSDAAQPAPPSAVTRDGAGATLDPRAGKCFKVRYEFGDCAVARFHGQFGDQTALILPDGQLGTASHLVPADEKFQPLSAEQLRDFLHQGPYLDYQVLQTEHYLIFYKSTLPFAKDSGRLLEDLYRGLIDAFRRKEFPVHESEFPLVAVIFATEGDFRAHKKVDPQVRAYYEYFTNRIFFFQKSEKEDLEPKVAALLSPQTVAHEGAHQILSNIGVQPRPNSWPLWLVEGLAEYCATTVNTRKGIVWSGMGAINSLHMATIRELEDPLSNLINGQEKGAGNVAWSRSILHAESLMQQTSLTPTDYARAWALTNYLALRRGSDFIKYLKSMSQMPPFERRTPQANLAEFRTYFSDDLARLDKKVDDYIHLQSKKKNFDALYYYAVVFEQSLGNGVVHRGAYVSQSPQMIEQWVLEMTQPQGAVPSWQANPWPTRARAILAAQEWMRMRGY
jgi:uncharacterized protein (DUF3820 family)